MAEREEIRDTIIADIMGDGPSPEGEARDEFRRKAEEAESERSGVDLEEAGKEEGEREAEESTEEGVDPEAGEEGESSDEGTVTIKRSEWDRKVQVADGRLQELRDLRQQLQGTNQGIEELRRQFMEATAPPPIDPREEAVAKYGKEIVDHPSIQYITERMGRLEQTIQGAVELTPEEEMYEQQMMIDSQVNEFTQTDVGHFQQEVPDFADAYGFAREARRKSLLHLPPQEQEFVLEQEERALAIRAMHETQTTGQYVSPAKLVYDIAVAYGYESAGYEDDDIPFDADDVLEDAKRIAAGVASSEGTGASTSARFSGEIRREDYANLPDRVRKQLAADPERFRELIETGRTSI